MLLKAMSKRILIAEDDRSSLMLLKIMVEADGGIEVVPAADGEEAWTALMGGSSFDACILDVMMPVTDGLELTKRIRAHPDMRRLPVILCTAQHDRSTVGQAAALSISVKPYARERVLKHVRRICEGHAASANIEPFEHAARRLGITERQLTGFLADVVKETTALAASLREGSAETDGSSPLGRINAVKGAASNFGAFGMGRALTGLEEAFRSGGVPKGSDLVRDLAKESERLGMALAAAGPAPVAPPAAEAIVAQPEPTPAPTGSSEPVAPV